MNKDIWEGKWRKLKGSIQARWGKLTNDDIDIIRGSQEKLAGRVQERYGYAKEEAEKDVKEFFRMQEEGLDADRPRASEPEIRVSAR